MLDLGRRPTKRVRPRAALAWKRAGDPPPTSSYTVVGVRQALQGTRPDRGDLDVALGQLQRVAGDQRRAGLRHLLHPGGEMGRLADRGVVHVEIAADRSHHHLTGIEPDPNLDIDALAPPELVGVVTTRLLHPQRGVAAGRRGLRGPLARRTAP